MFGISINHSTIPESSLLRTFVTYTYSKLKVSNRNNIKIIDLRFLALCLFKICIILELSMQVLEIATGSGD